MSEVFHLEKNIKSVSKKFIMETHSKKLNIRLRLLLTFFILLFPLSNKVFFKLLE